MTCHRRYFFEHRGEYRWPDNRYPKLVEFLRVTCEKRWWFNEPQLEGVPFNRLSLSITVSARDQWFCHRRAMRLIEDVYTFHLRMPASKIPEPFWETLEPEGGRYLIPASPWGG